MRTSRVTGKRFYFISPELCHLLAMQAAIIEEAGRIASDLLSIADDVMRNYTVGRKYQHVDRIWKQQSRIDNPSCSYCGFPLCGGLAFSTGGCALSLAAQKTRKAKR